MNNKFISSLKFIFGWPLSLVALFFIAKLVSAQSGSIASYFKSPNLFLLIPGALLLSSYFFLRSYVWKKLLDEKGYSVSLREASYLWGISEFKRYTPGFIWAFVGKTLSFGEKGIDKKTIANLILIEISFFMLGTIIASLLAGSFIFSSLFPNLKYLSFPVVIFTFFVSMMFVFNKNILDKIKLPGFLKYVNLALPDFKPYSNFKLLIVSVFSHFIFGLGTFLVISSIIYLPLEKGLALVGLFTLSLLVGYLSIIAPMGLGVREGFITLALSKIISLQTAGLASIFARIVFIFSEILFLLFIFSWRNFKIKFIDKTEEFVSKYRYEIILGLLILIYIIYYTTISFLRHDNFFTGRFDLGNMDQTVWNTINGRIFAFSNPDGTNIVSRLSFHADFLLILLSPFYLIWNNPKMLLLIQTIVLGMGAVFVYLISKDLLKNKNISLAVSASYLLNPSLGYSNLYDFHPVVLATTFLLGAFYFVRKKKYTLFLIFLFLACISKEQIWLIAAIFGLYVFFIQSKRLFGGALTILSASIFYLLIAKIIPSFYGGEHFALSYYSEFGDSPASVIKNIIFSPALLIKTLLTHDIPLYAYKLLLPVGFLPFLFPFALIFATPDLLIGSLSDNVQLRQIYYQYSAAITPFIFISTIYSIKFITDKFRKIPLSFFSWYILFFALISAYFLGPLPLSKRPNISVFTEQLSYRKDVINTLKQIPQDASVTSSNNLGAHLSHREKLYTLPLGVEEADYVAFLLTDNFAQPSLSAQKELAKNLKQNKRYYVVYEKDDFIVFKKYANLDL
ncbi:MAG: DUF2079 domain-containing protein [Patescibacteria group bacterium]